MPYTGYFKTEKNTGAKWNGWLWLVTCINQIPGRTSRRMSTGSEHFIWKWPTQNIYCHQDAPTEPSGDGQILTSTFDDAETEYSGAAGYIKSFTSETGFFSFNQDFSLHPAWTAYFTVKHSGLAPNYIGYFDLEIYKRDASNVDTFLFAAEYIPTGTIYPAAGLSMPLYPTGAVTTDDRLRVRVKMAQRLPS